MIKTTPVYTIENECQDCYKCVRRCHCKAIRIVNGKASVIPENCVSCGECVKVCPSHAKKIRSELSRLKQMLENDNLKIYASVAPSFPAYFPGTTIGQLATALKKIGFTGVSETALGAQSVSSQTAQFLKNTDLPLAISSACPACVDYIRKYHPQYTDYIVPLHSPAMAHCKMIKETFGNDCKVVFIGPCAAKKNEADRNPETLSLALTFAALEELLDEHGIVPMAENESELIMESAQEGRFYAIEGGMNDTLRDDNQNVRYLSVSGLENLDHMLSLYSGTTGKRKIFLEALACPGGCINGPVIPADAGGLEAIAETDRISSIQSSSARESSVNIAADFAKDPLAETKVTESEITVALAKVGKFTRDDELNCGACGYNTCREFAKALLLHKAEEAMCHTYLRKNFERTSNALIRFIPAAVVMVDENLQICECNRNFAMMSGMTEVFDALGNLNTIAIETALPDFAELFESVVSNGGEIEKFNQKLRDKIVNISVFTIARGKSAGAVIQDITKNELQREHIAEKAREVIRKNVLTVQQVARLFGEHVADTEILLNEIAGSYETRGGE